jgi:oligopeptide/dipeptide ABC transporter ATP-binding protein
MKRMEPIERMDPAALIEVRNLTKHYPIKRHWLARPVNLAALAGVSFSLEAGGTFGLVGESGSGKSTVAKIIIGAEQASSGEVEIGGHAFGARPSATAQAWRRRTLQPVLQDPYGSLNPHMKVGRIVDEPLRIQHALPSHEYRARVAQLLEKVGLSAAYADRLPHELSGGQRQRVAIARALALDPAILVLDEPVSALDVSVQAQVLNLLKDLQAESGLTYLLISHDLAVVAYMSTRIGVLYLGQFMELGSRDAVIERPAHPYTQALLTASEPQSPAALSGVALEGEIPSPLDPPARCPFHPRCPQAQARCIESKPLLRQIGADHWVACHFSATHLS